MSEREKRDVDHDSVKEPNKIQEETPAQDQGVMAKQPAKKKKGCFRGCLTVFLIFLAVVVIGGVVAWRFALNPRMSPMARALADTPMDYQATMAVREELARHESTEGVFTAVLPLSDEGGQPSETAGSIVLVGLNAGADFVPAWGVEGMGSQARDIVGGIVEANRREELGIKASSFSFSDGDQAVITIGVPMDIQEAWIDGRINDGAFLEHAQVRLDDPGYLVSLVETLVDDAIGRAFRDAIMGPFRR